MKPAFRTIFCISFHRLRYPSEDNSTFENIINTTSPVHVIVDQQSEHLYWTENEIFSRIGRSNLDGTNAVTVVNESNAWALAIDFKNRFDFLSPSLDFWCQGT